GIDQVAIFPPGKDLAQDWPFKKGKDAAGADSGQDVRIRGRMKHFEKIAQHFLMLEPLAAGLIERAGQEIRHGQDFGNKANAVTEAGHIKREPVGMPTELRREIAGGTKEIPPLDAAGTYETEPSLTSKFHQTIRGEVACVVRHFGAHLPGESGKRLAPFGHRAAIGGLGVLNQEPERFLE